MSQLRISNIELSNDASLTDKINRLINQIKKQPTDSNLRLALVQYYCLSANWEKAQTTITNYLKINANDENSKILLAYNITAESKREKVLTGDAEPSIYENCDNYIFTQQNALLQNSLNSTNATNLFLETVDTINERDQIEGSFYIQTADTVMSGLWLDTDVRTAFVLEVFVQEQYYWIPLINIAKVVFKESEYLTDILWRRGELHLTDGRVVPAFMPARYVVTDKEEISDSLKLCRQTDWQAFDELQIANGQKVLTNGDEDVSLLDILAVDMAEIDASQVN